LFVLIITLPAIKTASTNRAYSQQPDQMELNVTDLYANIQTIPIEKVTRRYWCCVQNVW